MQWAIPGGLAIAAIALFVAVCRYLNRGASRKQIPISKSNSP